MLYAMACAIAELSSDVHRVEGESPEHFVVDMFAIAADSADVMVAAAERADK